MQPSMPLQFGQMANPLMHHFLGVTQHAPVDQMGQSMQTAGAGPTGGGGGGGRMLRPSPRPMPGRGGILGQLPINPSFGGSIFRE